MTGGIRIVICPLDEGWASCQVWDGDTLRFQTEPHPHSGDAYEIAECFIEQYLT